MAQKLNIQCSDGYALQATFYPANSSHGIVINAAMGVSQRFYTKFAEYMSANGVSVLSYDYRGMERNKRTACDTDILTWGKDQTCVLKHAQTTLGVKNITLLGNSIGGQIIGMMNDQTLFNQVVLVTSQIGDWRLWPLPVKLKIMSLWYTFIPLLTVGKRFPSHWLGLGKGQWPSPVARMWASWGRKKNYLFHPSFKYDHWGWHNLSVPIYSIGFSDDEFAPEPAIQGLLAQYKSAQIEHQSVKPQDHNLKTIGHFGYFNKKCQPLWQQLNTWIKK